MKNILRYMERKVIKLSTVQNNNKLIFNIQNIQI